MVASVSSGGVSSGVWSQTPIHETPGPVEKILGMCLNCLLFSIFTKLQLASAYIYL